MERVPVCVVGCGGMGYRHILAYKELADTGIGNAEVVGVCDVRPQNAAFAADEAERLFGKRPIVFADVDQVVASSEVAALDVVTDPSVHHSIVVPALLAGKHALIEKPMAITVRACQAMIGAAAAGHAVLAIAENYRRDPVNRLARSIVEHGLLGDPYLMISTQLGGGDGIDATAWRHLKEKGAVGLNFGAHPVDIVQYYMGEFAQVFGRGLIVEPVRRKAEKFDHPLAIYRDRYEAQPDTVHATGEDAVFATYGMQSGAMVHFALALAGRGGGGFERSVHGRWGFLRTEGDRNGRPVTLRLEGRELKGKEILPLLPNFHHDEITERLFGPQTVEYDLPRVDSRLLAIEFHDFARAILTGGSPEVDGFHGMTVVAAILGAYESGLAGRSVTMEELFSGKVRSYQADIDAALGLG